MRELVISKYEAGQRFDKFLAKYMELALTFYLYLNDMDGDFLDDN